MNIIYKKVFLGGTCNGSTWRDELIPMLKIEYFNPVVPEWDYKAQIREEKEKEISYYRLYVITPKMKGVYSIAELIDDSNKVPKRTLFSFLDYGDDGVFSESETKSNMAVARLAKSNGAKFFKSLEEIAHYLNANDNFY